MQPSALPILKLASLDPIQAYKSGVLLRRSSPALDPAGHSQRVVIDLPPEIAVEEWDPEVLIKHVSLARLEIAGVLKNSWVSQLFAELASLPLVDTTAIAQLVACDDEPVAPSPSIVAAVAESPAPVVLLCDVLPPGPTDLAARLVSDISNLMARPIIDAATVGDVSHVASADAFANDVITVTPVDIVPVEASSVQAVPARAVFPVLELVPLEAAAVEAAAVEAAAIEAAAVEAAAVEAAAIEAAAIEAAAIEAAAIEAAAIEAAAVEAAAVEAAAVEAAAVEAAAVEAAEIAAAAVEAAAVEAAAVEAAAVEAAAVEAAAVEAAAVEAAAVEAAAVEAAAVEAAAVEAAAIEAAAVEAAAVEAAALEAAAVAAVSSAENDLDCTVNAVDPVHACNKCRDRALLSGEDLAATTPAGEARTYRGRLRAGQVCENRSGDLVVVGTVGPGAVVRASGSVHAYGRVSGVIKAGQRGDTTARIYVADFNAQIVDIAGRYQTFETVPEDLRGRMVEIWLENDVLFYQSI